MGPLLNLPLIGQIPFPFSGLDLVLDFGLGLGLVNLVGNKTLFIELTIHVLHKQTVDRYKLDVKRLGSPLRSCPEY